MFKCLLWKRILRDMAGPMTAADMESCFKPPPWGNRPKPSPIEILTKEHPYLYTFLVNVTYDKQCEYLKVIKFDILNLKN